MCGDGAVRSEDSRVGRLRLRRRADLLLAVADAGTAAFACWLAYVLRFQGQLPLPAHYAARYFGVSVGVCAAIVVAGRGAGLYRRAVLRPGTRNLEPAVEAALVVGVAVLIVNATALDGDLSQGWVALVTLFLLLLLPGVRSGFAHARRGLVPLGIGLERYVVVGSDRAARRLVDDLTRAAGAPFRVVGTLPADLTVPELATQARSRGVEGLVFTPGAEPTHVATLAGELAGHGIDVLLAPRLGDLDLRVASVVTMHGVPLLRLAGAAPRRKAVRATGVRSLRRGVAILGTRGIPANYGGFETFAERLALHLVGEGIPVTVYCRKHHAIAAAEWRGVRLVTLPTIRNKYLDTVVHTALSALHLVARTRIRDVVLCNAANAPVLPFLRAAGRRVVMNVDGLEWRRGKWGIAGRSWYRMGEWLSVRAASVLVTDADEVRTYYRVRHDTDSVMVPYGADLLNRHELLPDGVDVAADGFALYVSRWEAENNPVLVARAHARADVTMPLVMLGRATYDDDLDRAVRAAAAPHAWLPGPIFGAGYRGLQSNARCYIHATEVGGTHPALIEAMGAGNLCLVLDTPENREVAGPDAWLFADEDELVGLLRKVDAMTPEERVRLGAISRQRAALLFSWDAVGRRYHDLLTGEPSSR
jgi:glycosyltransferase involved in cell wall biosynthesis